MAVDQKKRTSMVSAFRLLLAQNGLIWTTYALVYVCIRKIFKNCQLPFLDRRLKALEQKYGLPGINATEINYVIWQAWDWESQKGDEWSFSSEWKESLINDVLFKYIPGGTSVLEIGPGAGRWTEILQQLAHRLTIVDLSDRCIELCKERFKNCDNLDYFVTDGSSLPFIPEASIDQIWSYDVFVHITPRDIEKYIAEFSRILKKNGVGVIHHAKEGGLCGGWRSSMTDKLFAEYLSKNNLTLIEQFDSWGPDGQYDVKLYHDTFSVFRKQC